MIKFEEIPPKVDELFKKLNENNLLIPFKEDPLWDKISSRNNLTIKILEAKYMILEDKELFNKYKKFWSQFFINEDDVYHDYIQQSASFILSGFEYTKRFLRMVLNLEKLNIKTTATLGQLLEAISEQCKIDKNELLNLFNLELRDIIAHDSWFYEQKDFCYKKINGKIIRLSFKDFHQAIKNLNELMASIAISWRPYGVDLEFQSSQKK